MTKENDSIFVSTILMERERANERTTTKKLINVCETRNNISQRHEPWSYETTCAMSGLFNYFTSVKMKGPNKRLTIK